VRWGLWSKQTLILSSRYGSEHRAALGGQNVRGWGSYRQKSDSVLQLGLGRIPVPSASLHRATWRFELRLDEGRTLRSGPSPLNGRLSEGRPERTAGGTGINGMRARVQTGHGLDIIYAQATPNHISVRFWLSHPLVMHSSTVTDRPVTSPALGTTESIHQMMPDVFANSPGGRPVVSPASTSPGP
jgi:hypothetical protein